MQISLPKKHLFLLGLLLVSIVLFSINFVLRQNYEFIIYIGVIIVSMVIIALSYRQVPYTDACLVGLTVWAILHMAGGALFVNGQRLYDIILIPLSQSYPILRYDQAVHIWGFGASTITMYCLLIPLLNENIKGYIGLSIVVIMAGLGVGALNEILEFIVDRTLTDSGVGGYINSSLDLVADFIGAILAMIYIRLRYLKKPNHGIASSSR